MNASHPAFPKKFQRVKTPWILQGEASECGAVALSIILEYFGCSLPLEELRRLCSVSRDGSSAYHIIAAAQLLGLEAEGISGTLEDLYQAPKPLIAFWNFDHFVVIEGFHKTKVFINDPESGPRSISYAELNEAFTGVFLTFKPSSSFKKRRSHKKSWYFTLFERIKPFKATFMACSALALFSSFSFLVLALLNQSFIDHFLQDKQPASLSILLLSYFGWLFFFAALQYSSTCMVHRLCMHLSTAFSCQFVQHLLRLPLAFFSHRHEKEVASRLELADESAKLLSLQLIPLAVQIASAGFIAFYLLFYDFFLTFFLVSLTTLFIGVNWFYYRLRESGYTSYRQIRSSAAAFAVTGIESFDAIQASAGERGFIARYGALQAKFLGALQKAQIQDHYLSALSALFSHFSHLGLLIFGSLKILDKQWSIGEFLAFQLLFEQWISAVSSAVPIAAASQELKLHRHRLEEVLFQSIDPVSWDFPSPTPLDFQDTPKIQGRIEVKDLFFGYSPLERPILRGIDLVIEAGTIVAITGLSGSGKSTLVKLIAGLLLPNSGTVLIDGQAPSERLVGIAEPHASFFADSITSNISFLDPSISLRRIEEACQDACIHDEILQKGGYERILNKQGYPFSGGERQRIEIARLFARQPLVMIFDEATMAVDPQREQAIFANLRKKKKTTLVITHRLQTIEACDEIVVLQEGKVVEK